LCHDADAPLDSDGSARDIHTIYQRQATGWQHARSQDAERRCFPCAVRAKQPEKLGATYLQHNPVYRYDLRRLLPTIGLVNLLHPFEGNHCFHELISFSEGFEKNATHSSSGTAENPQFTDPDSTLSRRRYTIALACADSRRHLSPESTVRARPGSQPEFALPSQFLARFDDKKKIKDLRDELLLKSPSSGVRTERSLAPNLRIDSKQLVAAHVESNDKNKFTVLTV
jgi:hypothetical protein